jgi:hypothetical protein
MLQASRWIERLQLADSKRLSRWFLAKADHFGYYYFHKSIEVRIVEGCDEVQDVPKGFATLDGVFYIRVFDPDKQDAVMNLLRAMLDEDSDRYQSLLVNLAGVLPAESEEELFRLKSVRLSERGFLPFEEALSVYAHLDPDSMEKEERRKLPEIVLDGEESLKMVPFSPLDHAGGENLLALSISNITDSILLDRLRLEFAGLCNQILSADGLLTPELEDLKRTCRKASGYLNLALERLCGTDRVAMEQVLRRHPILSLFRAGFTSAMKVKWEAERWVRGSWFNGRELGTTFWGEKWGGILGGLLGRRPRLYTGFEEGEAYKDFEWLSELGDCMKVLRRLMVLDGLIERLAAYYPVDDRLLQSTGITFRPLLFNLWARRLLNLELSFSEITLDQARRFFEHIRDGEDEAPYQMSAFEKTFVTDFMGYASEADDEAASVLEEGLSQIWRGFREEYARVSGSDLDSRYSKYLMIQSK